MLPEGAGPAWAVPVPVLTRGSVCPRWDGRPWASSKPREAGVGSGGWLGCSAAPSEPLPVLVLMAWGLAQLWYRWTGLALGLMGCPSSLQVSRVVGGQLCWAEASGCVQPGLHLFTQHHQG